MALFFNSFERPIPVTIIEQENPSFHLTVCNNLRPAPFDDILIRSIESVRLFTAHMNLSHTATTKAETTPALISKALMNWGLKNQWNPISTSMEDTTAINPPPSETQTATESGSHLSTETIRITTLAVSWASTTRDTETQEPLSTQRPTVVIPRKKRARKGVTKKIIVLWQNFTFSCAYSNRLTPAILLEDIGKELRVTLGSLTKAIMTPLNCPRDTLNHDSPLSQQRIVQGDTLRMLA